MASKTVKIFAVILVTLMILFGLMVFAFFQLTRPAKIQVLNDSVLELSIGGEITELPSSSPLKQLISGEEISLFDMRRLFLGAAQDENISAVYLKIYPLLAGWAEVEEMRSFIHAFRKSGKKIYVYLSLDLVNEIELYLASSADEIYLNPGSGLMINGLVAEFTFFKKMMDKLGIQSDVLQFKEFKSAENYTRSKLTPQVRSMYEGILGDIQSRFVQTIAHERQIKVQRINELIQRGLLGAQPALSEQLVTHLGYEDEIRTSLEVETPNGEKTYHGIRASQYLRVLNQKAHPSHKHRVAILAGIGPILTGQGDDTWGSFMGGDSMVSILRKIRQDKNVKGLLFRVNSPGGSAVGSDKIWREIRLMEEVGKPVVVSMSGVAGSGGYYIAMGASKIVAQPSTITGSIGVIFHKFNLNRLFDSWLGITIDRVKLAKNADIFSTTTSLTAQQTIQLNTWMSNIYEQFVKKASEGRHLTVEELEKQAGGRIFTGNQAKERKLVDEVGGLNIALDLLKQELNISPKERVELVLYPKPKNWWSRLLDGDWPQLSPPPQSFESFLRQHLSAIRSSGPWLIAPELLIH